jgi:hypothetical protein
MKTRIVAVTAVACFWALGAGAQTQNGAIATDVGLQDPLMGDNKELDRSLVRLGVSHTFETYEGTHTSRVKERFDGKVLPFFSTNLAAK